MDNARVKKIIGLKLLREDGGSLTGDHQRIIYPLGQWMDVPGNGAYIGMTFDGLLAGGSGPVLALFECENPTRVGAPSGVVCYGRVRMLSRCASAQKSMTTTRSPV